MPTKRDRVKFLADECVGLPTIYFLKEEGYSVTTSTEAGLNSKQDMEVLSWAIKEKRILITEDIDFGNIILYPPKLHHGIILLRFRHRLENEIHAILTKLLKELPTKDFNKTLIIVDAEKYRVRKE